MIALFMRALRRPPEYSRSGAYWLPGLSADLKRLHICALKDIGKEERNRAFMIDDLAFFSALLW